MQSNCQWKPGELDQNKPRTITVNIDTLAIESAIVASYGADMTINPDTQVAEPINLRPIEYGNEQHVHSRESMKQLVDLVIEFFEMKLLKVGNDELTEEEILHIPHVQEINPSTQYHLDHYL